MIMFVGPSSGRTISKAHKYNQRDLHLGTKARDGKHHGAEHHQRFAELFLDLFGNSLK